MVIYQSELVRVGLIVSPPLVLLGTGIKLSVVGWCVSVANIHLAAAFRLALHCRSWHF